MKDAESLAGRPVPPTERDTVYRGLLDRVILMKLLSSEAKVRGVAVTPQEVTDRIAQIKQQFPSEAEFQKELTKRHTTLAQLQEEQRRDLLNAKTIEAEAAPRLAVTDTGSGRLLHGQPGAVQGAGDGPRQPHPLRRRQGCPRGGQGQDQGGSRGRADARQGRRGFRGPGQAGPQGPLARRRSAAISTTSPRGRWCRAFDAAVFAMKPGEIEQLVETDFGFHIIKLTDRPQRPHRAARRGEGPPVGVPQEPQAAGTRAAVPPQPQGEVPRRSPRSEHPPASAAPPSPPWTTTRTVVTGDVWIADAAITRVGPTPPGTPHPRLRHRRPAAVTSSPASSRRTSTCARPSSAGWPTIPRCSSGCKQRVWPLEAAHTPATLRGVGASRRPRTAADGHDRRS